MLSLGFSHQQLEVDQVREVLHNLYQLRHVASTGDEVYVADHAIVTSSEVTTRQKVYNYMSTWYGWSRHLDSLPLLTKKIELFIKADSRFQISEKEVVEAIQGLGSLLSVKGHDSQVRNQIEEGIKDLNTALLMIESRQQDHLVESSPQNDQVVGKGTALLSHGWSHYIPNLSLPGLMSLAANQLNHSLSNWNYFSKKAHPLYSKTEQQLRPLIYPHSEENPSAFMQKIREFMVDPELTKKMEIALPKSIERQGTLIVPEQFFVDSTRFRKIILNNKLLYDLKADQPAKGNEIAWAMVQGLGQKVFERLGSVVHQSLVADQVVAWMLSLPQEWYEQDSPFSHAHFMQAESFSFVIDVQDELVKVDSKIPLVFNVAVDVDETREVQSVGYVMIHRQLTFVKKELEDEMKAVSSEERLPSLTVKHAISGFCSSLDEAYSHFGDL